MTPSPRYTLLLANRGTGTVRRLTFTRRAAVLTVAGIMAVPVLMGLGARWSAHTQIQALEANADQLRLENDSYRSATGELTTQIASLQSAITQIGDQAQLDPAVKQAIDRLPAVVKSRATGGPAAIDPSTLTRPAPGGTQTTFGALKDLLGVLDAQLQSVRTGIERQQALAAATPSIFPVVGWLSSLFGNRTDPFGEGTEFHAGIDLSADTGTPVKATADGTIETAGYNGAYGNSVLIKHGFGIETRYGHLSRLACYAGKTVHRGDVIGYVGATGHATGPHLHYEILINGQPINPLRLLTK